MTMHEIGYDHKTVGRVLGGRFEDIAAAEAKKKKLELAGHKNVTITKQ